MGVGNGGGDGRDAGDCRLSCELEVAFVKIMSMPFGPHSGTPVSELPDSYLYQLIEAQCRVVKPLRLWSELAVAVDEEAEKRGKLRRVEMQMRRAA